MVMELNSISDEDLEERARVGEMCFVKEKIKRGWGKKTDKEKIAAIGKILGFEA